MSQPVSGYLYPRNLVLLDGRRTVSGGANSAGVDVTQFKGNGVTVVAYVDTVTSSGNVTATVQESHDNISFAAVTGATLSLTATGLATVFVPNVSRKYLRLSFVLNSGTSLAVSHFVYGQPGEATTGSVYTTAPVGQVGI